MPDLRPVILSGGSGTRLWPLSTPEFPKQFAQLVGDRSLFEHALLRLSGVAGVQSPIIVTGRDQAALVQEACAGAGVEPALVIMEPEGRNTAPAAIAAALMAEADDVLVILPSDHLVEDTASFGSLVERAAAVAGEGYIVTFGVVPTRAETGYGYIEMGEELGGGAATVRRFIEKPDIAEAERLVDGGRHLWNSGMFVVGAGTLLSQAGWHCPELLGGVRDAVGDRRDGTLELDEAFARLDKISIDHAIMEKTHEAAVVPLDVGWDDVGSFQALWDVSARDGDANVVSGDVELLDVRRSLIRSTSRKVAVVGLEDVVVVETDDAVLVVARDRSQSVREIVDRLVSD